MSQVELVVSDYEYFGLILLSRKLGLSLDEVVRMAVDEILRRETIERGHPGIRFRKRIQTK
ncbi:MAG: hypothetical protein DRO11_02470 [Methanobacteriota archaeon]|nr:MAG: hypothetical protein DRO11_02470 [Euryarchaeota archaeon]